MLRSVRLLLRDQQPKNLVGNAVHALNLSVRVRVVRATHCQSRSESVRVVLAELARESDVAVRVDRRRYYPLRVYILRKDFGTLLRSEIPLSAQHRDHLSRERVREGDVATVVLAERERTLQVQCDLLVGLTRDWQSAQYATTTRCSSFKPSKLGKAGTRRKTRPCPS